MLEKKVFVLAMCCLLCSNIGFFSAAAPAVNVTAPANNSVSLTKAVTVSGTSTGSNAYWAETSIDDFNAGTMQAVVPAGTDVSALAVYDDFNSSSVTYQKWSIMGMGGVTASVSGGLLHAGGTGTDSGLWGARVVVLSTQTVAANISADLTSYTGSGTGWSVCTGLFQDLSNYILFGIEKDPAFGSAPQVYLGMVIDGSQSVTTYGDPPSGTMTFAIGLFGTSATMYLNDNPLATMTASFNNPKMWFVSQPRTYGDSVQAGWDSASLNYFGGGLSLTTAYDGFNGNSISTQLWTPSSRGGLSYNEGNGLLDIGGTGSSYNLWYANAMLTSTQPVVKTVSGNLISLSGSGSGWVSGIGLYQDASNYLLFGQEYDTSYSSPQIYVGVVSAGSQDTMTYGNIVQYIHNYAMTISGSSVDLYLDGDLLDTIDISLSSPSMWFFSSVRASGDSVDAIWDNAMLDHSLSGTFTSDTFDTLSVNPVLKAVTWGAATPSATAVAVQVRSSDDSDMSSPTAWTTVTKGQSSGLPAVKRYLQYMVTLTSTDGIDTPAFNDINMTYYKPVTKVEVSIDGQATWSTATGTDAWQIDLTLPENTTVIWVRATDVAGDTNVTSIRVDVDTTQPVGSIVINDNAPFTTDATVSLKLNATDHYGVASMILGEQADFSDATWQDYSDTLNFTLSSGDGPKTVYVEYRDANGLDSGEYNATIILDTLPPVGSVIIENGAQYTPNMTVTLQINATDQIGVATMMVSADQDFADAQWVPYATTVQIALAPGSGDRTVYIKFQDLGGHVSQVYSDMILLDQLAPSVTLSCNGGAVYTQSPNVTVGLVATENYAVASMQVGEGDIASISSLPWAPFNASVSLGLSQAEGTKTMSARLQDAAGNIGAVNSTTIILDYTAPKTTLGALPATSEKAAITVTWSATDATSGVLYYDVQSQTLNGTWTDWLVHTNLTSAVFTGADLQTYSFRARAQDKAGNLEPYPATVDNAVAVALPEPIVSFIKLKDNATVSSTLTVDGTCQVVTNGRNVTVVQYSIDNGPWQTVAGTLNWSFKVDTTKLKDGKHTLDVRTFDGKDYSTVMARTFTVKNAQGKGFLGADGTLVLLAAAAIGLVLAVKGRQRGAGRRKL